ncbi:L-lactate permease, partial [Anaerospora hongkongensis]|uniref:L-lactate permease n=1 Tax=Anaerospora hongkongensis TaxID=244830 RepID=UPI00289E6441
MLPVLTEGTFLSAFIALIPILWLLASLGIYKMPAHKACTIGLILGILIAIFVWRMPYNLVLLAALEGIVLALMPILWVILAAIFLYNISLKTGAMDKIKHLMSNLSGDRRVQVLIIAWGFGGFLEATAGFGTAVAIPASILIALGFDAFFAAILCLIANTIAVAFGGVGLPVTTLAKVTDLSVMQLTFDV